MCILMYYNKTSLLISTMNTVTDKININMQRSIVDTYLFNSIYITSGASNDPYKTVIKLRLMDFTLFYVIVTF